MKIINRKIVLNALVKHETLTIGDMAKEENLGTRPLKDDLKIMLDKLVGQGQLQVLNDVVPLTYTITEPGIEEEKRLNEEAPLAGKWIERDETA